MPRSVFIAAPGRETFRPGNGCFESTTSDIIKTNRGELVLTASNIFSGDVEINGGTLSITNGQMRLIALGIYEFIDAYSDGGMNLFPMRFYRVVTP